MTGKNSWFSQLFLRLAISVTMLSAVADRLDFWDENSAWGNWENFEKYTRKLTFFLPENLSVFSAYMATFLEIIFPLMLISVLELKPEHTVPDFFYSLLLYR